jgi:hypothetical protein
MSDLMVVGLGLLSLVGMGWLAARAGVDSRRWPVSEEERLAGLGFTWDQAEAPGPLGLVADQARLRVGDLRREADAERLVHLARSGQPVVAAPPARSGRAVRARLAGSLASLAARLDRAAALEATLTP